MKVTLTFVPPGGGEADHGIDVDLPALPRPGDYMSGLLTGIDGQSDFVVLRVRWYVKADGLKWKNPTWEGIAVECEYAHSSRSSKEHERAMKANKSDKPFQEFEESGF